jgi:type I restriction enzyme S subunit
MMTNGWQTVPLGEFLTQRKGFFTIDDFTRYKRARVQLHGRGIVLRDEVDGAEVKTKEQQAARTGEFLVAEIDAKVGGFGIVPPELDGAIVSSHYFLFEINEQKCLREWLDWLIRSGMLEDQVTARGSTNYSAIRPSHVLKFEIPLPPLTEQRRIVERIEALAARVAEAQSLRREASDEVKSFMQAALREVYGKSANWKNYKLDDVALINMGQSPAGDSYNTDGEGFPLLNGPTEFGQHHPTPRQWTTSPTKFCKPSDILICVRGATTGKMNWADQKYCIGRGLAALTVDTDKCIHEYVFYFVQTQTQEILARTAGSTFPNLPGEKLKTLPIPVPPLEEQRRLVAYLDGLQAQVSALRAAQAETEKELSALMPSVLDRAFKGEL